MVLPLKSVGCWLALLLLAGCAGSPAPAPDERRSDSRYTMDQDTAGDRDDFDISTLVVPQPRYEPRSRGGNFSPYTVWGETYEVMDSAVGYREEGIASWYGAKFHGHKTSNGEIYDMYTLTAAHKSLPLPTYARVTNLDNGKSTIVRVNDRGPFHGDRMIDLSYAAAKMLGFQGQGTARVEVEALATEPDNSPRSTAAGAEPVALESVDINRSNTHSEAPDPSGNSQQLFVQVGAFGQVAAAETLKQQLESLVQSPVQIVANSDGTLHRVRVGPMANSGEAESEQARIVDAQLGQPLIISRPANNAGNE
ncbi:MAG: septal ring lytic transglycosylase RlpA family protein [Halomonadaceae bacterium]|nr:MAG: septal ring lytic transglycosylase RlpA family protein [Halomonadaceae bacterium]